MKFVYLSGLFMACALSAGAQGIYQFADPGFDENWKTETIGSGFFKATMTEPTYGWHSFLSANNETGMGTLALKYSPNPEKISEGHTGYAVKLTSIAPIPNTYANGNLTTGKINMGSSTPSAHSNYNYSAIGTDNCLEFAGTPDAVTFWAKFKPGTYNENQQARGKFILHDEYEYKDPEEYFSGQESHRVALAMQLINESSEWKQYTVPFVYDERASVPQKQYLLASFTTNPNPGQSYNDELCLDDVYFVYYSDLSSLTYNGKKIDYTEDKSGEEITITDFSNEFYNSEKLQYELRGKGADCEGPVYDSETGIVTLTIKGDDFGHEVDPEKPNQTVYKIQFNPIQPILDEYNRLIKVDMGEEYGGVFPSINNVTISESESKDGTVAFTMKNFTFAGAIPVGNVTLTGATLSYADNGSINITAPEQELSLLGGAIYTKVSLNGNVAVVNGKKELTANVNINWYPDYPTDMSSFMPIQVAVSAIPFNTTLEGKTLKVTGSVAADEAAAVIPTDNDVNVVDLTEAALTDDVKASAFEAKNPNTLFYAAEGATLTGDNVVKGTECDNFVLTDGQSFNAPMGFTASKITYKRATAVSTDEKDEVYTFVLPFTFTADKVNGTVYELTGVNDGVLDFASVEESTELKANRPYLVVSNNTQLLKASEFTGEVSATGDLTNEVIGGVAMVGAYEATPITSDASWYGYNAKGEFVKATSGTINPFRAAIKSTGIAPSSYALKLDGTVTGILNLENPNAKVDVYTISGVCVRKNVPAASALNGLSRGVYIVGGQKVVK